MCRSSRRSYTSSHLHFLDPQLVTANAVETGGAANACIKKRRHLLLAPAIGTAPAPWRFADLEDGAFEHSA
jgi:hypothetical protein